MSLISAKEASEKLGVSVLRVQQLIWAKRIPAKCIGRDYVIDESDLQLVKERKNGRPPKAENGNQAKTEEKPFKTAFDIAPDLMKDLQGKHKNLPTDLSTNKKYLEGLGRD